MKNPFLRMKYVVFENDTFLIFPETMGHVEVAEKFPVKPISAGFVTPNAGGDICCYGESISLGLKSRGEKDNALLELFA